MVYSNMTDYKKAFDSIQQGKILTCKYQNTSRTHYYEGVVHKLESGSIVLTTNRKIYTRFSVHFDFFAEICAKLSIEFDE